MNKTASKEVSNEILNVLKKHGYDSLYYPHILGQVLTKIGGSIQNNVPWMLEGICYEYIVKNDVFEILTRLSDRVIAKFGDQNYNYNDLDCDIWANYQKIQKDCLKCSSLVAKLDKKSKKVNPADCQRCGGSKIDPEYYDEAWTLCWENHGYTTYYLIKKNCLGYSLHIRELPYNKSKKTVLDYYKKFISEIAQDRYDSTFEYLRYHDLRDKGCILSTNIQNSEHGKYCFDFDASLKAPYHLSTIVEHFDILLTNQE